jgi:hypothetical protein
MSKMGLHDPFGHFKHKLWPKEMSKVKLPIWLLTTKSQEFSDSLVCMWRATYHCKALNKDYNFALNLISIEGLHTKLWAPKVTRVLTLGISGFSLESFGTKWHLGAGPVAKHKVYYKGDDGGFPQVRAVVSLVSSNLPLALPSTKNVPTMH